MIQHQHIFINPIPIPNNLINVFSVLGKTNDILAHALERLSAVENHSLNQWVNIVTQEAEDLGLSGSVYEDFIKNSNAIADYIEHYISTTPALHILFFSYVTNVSIVETGWLIHILPNPDIIAKYRLWLANGNTAPHKPGWVMINPAHFNFTG